MAKIERILLIQPFHDLLKIKKWLNKIFQSIGVYYIDPTSLPKTELDTIHENEWLVFGTRAKRKKNSSKFVLGALAQIIISMSGWWGMPQ